MLKPIIVIQNTFWLLILMLLTQCNPTDPLLSDFQTPPETSKPGVYWYFMDGNLSGEEMTKDLESMKEVGLNHVIFLEVGIGVPRGPVDFMSEKWQELFVHAVRECERLGIKLRMGAGPGWCGSGGPWVKPEESMKHLVSSEVNIQGGQKIDMDLPLPEQRSTRWHRMSDPYYQDFAVYAIPSMATPVIEDITEKALYERSPYSSVPGVKPHLPALPNYMELADDETLRTNEILDISAFMDTNGHISWDAPAGQWTIIRMGVRVTGASTRPSPLPVIGLESDKLNTIGFENHLKNFTDILLEKTAPRKKDAGWTGFHIDSWESGAQNWTEGILEEFQKRRGYDPEPYLLSFTGRALNSVEFSERFLWDFRLTCQDLLLENHAEFAKEYAHKHGLELTIEPYDMNPAGDLDLGAVADVIMAEFWSKRFGYQTAYAVVEATSISHITGQPIVGAEVFTTDRNEIWQEYPWSMKDQSDWALALGVNRFTFHTFAHKPLGDEYRPGMTMGVHGVHWDRGQTWWPFAKAYHEYVSRCSHMMQQGQAVSDILYLTPEGAPMVFTPPSDALYKNGAIPDKKGYGFDACSPKMLMERASVSNGKITFPGASSYEIMVLPSFKTMTPELLERISDMVRKGAKIIGNPPVKSPSLSQYPGCDSMVENMAVQLWGTLNTPLEVSEIEFGEGAVFWGGELSVDYSDSTLYPSYNSTINVLRQFGIQEDFSSESQSVRFGHRIKGDKDIYFIANRSNEFLSTECMFRAEGSVELWQGTTGESRKIKNFTAKEGITTIPLEFFPYESYFVIITGNKAPKSNSKNGFGNFPETTEIKSISGSWDVSFDPKFGGPEHITFSELQDWTKHEQGGIKYYSGIATYKKDFEVFELDNRTYYLDLGTVNDIAQVTLNGTDVGIIWCAPWRIDVSHVLKKGSNQLEIKVANRWVNRLLGDQQEADANVRTVQFENGFLEGREFLTGRYTFTTERAMTAFRFNEPLPSGLIGPVKIIRNRE